jgi:hypothetical protein
MLPKENSNQRKQKMPEAMEIDFQPIPSWALVSANPHNSNADIIPPLEPIKLHSIPQWGHTLMSQLQHTAAEISSLRCQIQEDETEASVSSWICKATTGKLSQTSTTPLPRHNSILLTPQEHTSTSLLFSSWRLLPPIWPCGDTSRQSP